MALHFLSLAQKLARQLGIGDQDRVGVASHLEVSSAAGDFAMRYSGSSFASSCFAGSSEGNTLSVMAICVLAMT
jgi:hypothetical protein